MKKTFICMTLMSCFVIACNKEKPVPPTCPEQHNYQIISGNNKDYTEWIVNAIKTKNPKRLEHFVNVYSKINPAVISMKVTEVVVRINGTNNYSIGYTIETPNLPMDGWQTAPNGWKFKTGYVLQCNGFFVHGTIVLLSTGEEVFFPDADGTSTYPAFDSGIDMDSLA